ncbi:MAG: type I 3-dehydroquinate dehydratase [Deltaproteobacteria bacterium RIFCSPLOWO2_12_FULL_43_16]|nr:MAG: type I 3-dehydroquinate dehydratase [Deltaproteobacteria bacterium GWA2_43_19]OGQ13183.1 MAG: type I 3-dehydroquinate dehydratase [Deltaproteobacteria bacterium RIFCSPHIGHO2_02_FULL_43_33]OGQ36235.1 MAG: type I 3-dehydroquinate dehydratase [Deltaproteobacteria bacterium RIFCSPLOWO2_01_FULL_42_9]OGQ57553.1 MAG: type I 3-dehydroquinate dehydratase [Deltaproteobacteria bacterium RIFCSPLOWO2_12_FULL_43_16]HBR16550.1 type I 3-dehydroquinate dehydratase [Deltaproteobacteria bacterium]
MKIGKLKLGDTPRIAAVIVDGEDRKAIAAAKRDGADLLELRIDCFKKQDVVAVQKIVKHIQTKKLPLLATIRSKAEGGKSGISEKERLRLFQNIMPLVDAVDIELGSKKILGDVIKEAHRFKKKVIVSYHNFKNTPEQKKLEAIIKNSKKAGGDIVKIAAFAKNKKDIIRLASLAASHSGIITIAMGSMGIVSRILFPMLGSLLTYCSVTKSSAPGQISLKTTAALLKETIK